MAVREMVTRGKNKTAHTSQKDNGAVCQREHCTSKYSVKNTIHKTLTTVKSPVKVSMDSRRLTHSSEGDFKWKDFKTVSTDLGNNETEH
jgi:hypothetical protein